MRREQKNHLSVSNAVCQMFSGSDFQILDKHPSLSVLGDKYGSFVTDLFSDDNNSLFLFPEQTIRRCSNRFMWKVKEIKSATLFAVSRHNVFGLFFFLLFGCSPPPSPPSCLLSLFQWGISCGGKTMCAPLRQHSGGEVCACQCPWWYTVMESDSCREASGVLCPATREEEKCTTIGCLRLLPRGPFSLISSRALPARLTTANV